MGAKKRIIQEVYEVTDELQHQILALYDDYELADMILGGDSLRQWASKYRDKNWYDVQLADFVWRYKREELEAAVIKTLR